MKLSIVIPCYNEAKNIPLILEKYGKIIFDHDIEVVLVNNGSTDETVGILRELLPKYSFLKIVNVSVNQGYGYGILSGLKESAGDFIGWTHGDMQTPAEDVVAAFGLIQKNGYDPKLYCKGTRRGRPLFDVVFTVGMSVFETLYLGTWLYDINAQPNIFHRSFFEKWKNPPDDFSLDLYALYSAKKEKLKIVRFPVFFLKRIYGESHWNKNFASKWKFIKRTMEFSVKLKKNNL
ncbi:MAG: glycosyltransferase family 2 protein [Candidatus Pacebacteria bacterium]|jgi:glycosyltransferase involved in cell wall biosynthesis|nr:glycosyltransferase family 2 protein [Candidatus Paceibacterota bacterium]